MEERLYKPGEHIGNYEVLELLAGGGFSAIYKARDLKDVPKAGPSAVKISRFNFRTVPRDLRVELNARMWREHEELARLDHQNIVRIFEWGLHEAKVWYAMELLDGPTLGTYLAEERRTILDLMLTYRQVLEAIAHCHSNGVVHRDLKPSNIIVTRELGSVVRKDDEDHSGGGDKRTPSERLKTRLAVLIDFGTGHLVGSPPVTAPGTLLGTAEYLPPWYVKQALAGKRLDRAYKAEPVDDVYQLGVLLYAMLTGVLPTRTSSAQPLRLLEEIRDVMPVHPRELNPEAPQALSDLAMRCLQKRSTRLPPDAAELRREWLAAMERDGEALRATAPEFEARQETTMAETTLGMPVSEPTVREEPPKRAKPFFTPARGLQWATLAVLGALVLVSIRAELRAQRTDAQIERLDATQAKTAEALNSAAQALQLLVANRLPGPVPLAAAPAWSAPGVSAFLGGLKMPDKPRPEWLRPGKDGVCRNPQTGEMLRPHAVIRGSCWFVVGRKITKESTCLAHLYDAPPEILKDPKQELLAMSCFEPYTLEGGSVINPRP